MDVQVVTDYLAHIRTLKNAELRRCSLVTDEFVLTPPHAVGIAHLMLRPRMLLGDPTGTGKTPQALVAYAHLKEKNPNLKMLVTTTQTAQFQWVRAVQRFLKPPITAAAISYEQRTNGSFQSLTPEERLQQWPRLMNTDVWVTTGALAIKEHVNLLTGLDRFIFIPDETQAYKSFKGEVAYPTSLKISQKATCCWGLTATPMMNDRLDELYSVMELIRPGTFGGDFSAFKKTYYQLLLIKPKWNKPGTDKKARAFYKTVGYQNLELLRSQVEPFFLKRPFTEFQQYLPPVTFQQWDVALDPKQRSLYSDLKKKQMPGAHTKIQQLAALTFAQMAVDAPITLGFASIPSAKTTELLRLLQENFDGRKVIVYSKFEKVVTYLSQQLGKAGIKHGIIAGPVSPVGRLKAQDAFQQSADVNVILITSAGAQALDLQAADTVICYDLPWSWGEFQQIVGRARRVGSKSLNVLVVMLCAENSIDTIVADRLTKKEKTIHLILGADAGMKLSEREHVKAGQNWQAAMAAIPGDQHVEDAVIIGEEDLTDLFQQVAA